MAYVRMDVKSEVMDMYTSLIVLLPDGAENEDIPVVFLLHGLCLIAAHGDQLVPFHGRGALRCIIRRCRRDA